MKQRVITVCSIAALLLIGSWAYAAEADYPRQSFTAEELQQVRAWEKTWAGKKIDSSNVDQVKQYLPETFYNIMKDTGRWGESYFTIVPYAYVAPTPGNVALTKKYYGKCKLGSKGELLNYVSGVPFPGSTNPTELAHNFRTRTLGDTYKSTDSGFIVDGRLKYDMDSNLDNNLCFFSGRTDMPPVPEYENNPKDIWRAFSMHQLAPPETRNMRIMEISYNDRMKPYDSWYWMPSIRRIRRRSTTERQDSQGGADYCGFDNMGWDGPIQINTYKLLGRKDYLLVRHSDNSKLLHTPGDCIFDGTQRERINCYVLEVKSRDDNFLYNRMLWYLDPESWQMLYSDRYDRSGKLWKVLDQQGCVKTGYNGVPFGHFAASQTIDVQRKHSTLGKSELEFAVDFPKRMFTLQWLQKHGY